MNLSADERIAKFLQNEFESSQFYDVENCEQTNSKLNDSNLELSDPTPSIYDLFVRFDKNFFWSSLGMVQVLWSNRMTKCAGMCYFEGKHGLCKISLSAPLLSLRPRKDLVETLLHEMIHAYLFVTNNYKDREDHGPEFRKHMHRINNVAGTNISVYHTFYDEVKYYQRHIWRCDGPCRFKKPYYGFVRRSMNRAPGPNDIWWNQHKMECNGNFVKISEPEKKVKKSVKSKNNKKNDKIHSGDIRDLLNLSHHSSQLVKIQNNSKNTVVEDLKTNNLQSFVNGGRGLKVKSDPIALNENFVDNKVISNLLKGKEIIYNFKNENTDFNCKENQNTFKNSHLVFGKDDTRSEKTLKDFKSISPRDFVRNFWSKKYSVESDASESSIKKIKIDVPECSKLNQNTKIEENIKKVKNEKNSNINNDSEVESLNAIKMCPACGKDICSLEMNDHLDNCLYSLVFNEKENENNISDINSLVACPCCYQLFSEHDMDFHIDECLTKIALKQEMLEKV